MFFLFSCINSRWVPREVLKTETGGLKTETGGQGFQHLPRDPANVNAQNKHVQSLLLHKYNENVIFLPNFWHFCFGFSPPSRALEFHSYYGNNRNFKMVPELVPSGCMPMPYICWKL